MRFTANIRRSGSVSGSGTVRSGSLHGIDSTSAEDERSFSRADGVSFYDGSEQPGTVNMIRTGLGQISKRPGFSVCQETEGFDTLGGVFKFTSPEKELYFYISGSTMTVSAGQYVTNEEDDESSLTVSLPDDFSDCTAAQSDDCMFFMNGSFLFVYRALDGKSFYIGKDGQTSVSSYSNPFEGLYLPVLFIGCTPSGTGSSYEAVNLLNPYVSEQFIADGTSNEYTVHMDIKPDTQVHAFVKNASGGWENAAVLSFTGRKVKFTIPPQKTQVEGEDNLKIIYMHDSFADNAHKIACCRCMTMYGVGGYKDRVFLSGNESLPNLVYYSEMDSHLYFPDLNYLKVGDSDTEVVALAGDDTRLAVICSDNVYMVSGGVSGADTEVEFIPDALFLISGIYKTPLPYSGAGTAVFDNEVVYLTENGIVAVTASGVLNERCCQVRSAMINYHLLQESLSDCRMLVFGDFLVISNRSETLYLLDSKQYFKSGSEPYSRRQYDGYIWKGVNAKYMWVQDGDLYFSDGEHIFRFNRGFSCAGEYRDEIGLTDGVPVYRPVSAYWETPDIYCQSFHLNKFFSRMGVWLAGGVDQNGAPVDTDVKISAKFDNDDWRIIKDYGGQLSSFKYERIYYSCFTYNRRPKSYAVYSRLLHKRGKCIRLRFENDNYYQPFTMKSFLVEYSIM